MEWLDIAAVAALVIIGVFIYRGKSGKIGENTDNHHRRE